MVNTLRIATLLIGLVLIISPAMLIYGFAACVGDLNEIDSLRSFLTGPVLIGLVLGVGPTFVGVPKLVEGQRKSTLQVFAGMLMIIALIATSIALLVMFQGTVGILVALALGIEVAAFKFFIWPAHRFANPTLNSDAQSNSAPVS